MVSNKEFNVGDRVKIISKSYNGNNLHSNHKVGDIVIVMSIHTHNDRLVRVSTDGKGGGSGWNYYVGNVVVKVDDVSDLPLFKGVVNA